jgi:hypothetical protein
MSLINDALKRAQQAHDRVPPTAPGPQLRPAEPASHAGRRAALMIPTITILGLGLAGFFGWRMVLKGRQIQPQSTIANTRPASRAAQPMIGPQTVSGRTGQTAAQAQAAVSADQLKNLSTSASVSSAPVPDPGRSATGSLAKSEKSATAKAGPLKLQGIFFHPTRPAAMISGNTVYIGDQIGNLRVVAIDQHTATLAGGGVTNILKLPKQY